MSDHVHGTAEYYLENISDNLFRISERLDEILKLETENHNRNLAHEQEVKNRGHREAEAELTRVFGEMLTLARRPDVIVDFYERLKENLLAEVARGLTVLQDGVNEVAMRRLKEQAETQGVQTHETLDTVKSPFVAIVPK